MYPDDVMENLPRLLHDGTVLKWRWSSYQGYLDLNGNMHRVTHYTAHNPVGSSADWQRLVSVWATDGFAHRPEKGQFQVNAAVEADGVVEYGIHGLAVFERPDGTRFELRARGRARVTDGGGLDVSHVDAALAPTVTAPGIVAGGKGQMAAIRELAAATWASLTDPELRAGVERVAVRYATRGGTGGRLPKTATRFFDVHMDMGMDR